MGKREEYISWDEYFAAVSVISEMRSKDPSTQVGACIIGPDNIILGIGYNGLPRGMDDDEFDWLREAEKSHDTKYPYVIHAEKNAIFNSKGDLKGATLYTTLFPCSTCAGSIAQKGIQEIVYLGNKYKSTDDDIAANIILNSAKIKTRALDLSGKITIDFDKYSLLP